MLRGRNILPGHALYRRVTLTRGRGRRKISHDEATGKCKARDMSRAQESDKLNVIPFYVTEWKDLCEGGPADPGKGKGKGNGR